MLNKILTGVLICVIIALAVMSRAYTYERDTRKEYEIKLKQSEYNRELDKKQYQLLKEKTTQYEILKQNDTEVKDFGSIVVPINVRSFLCTDSNGCM